VQFDRDIAKIVISSHELINAEAELKRVALNNKSFKVVSSKTLQETFEKFARKYGIVVEQV
jgi:ABC-type multidrug transport system ATPase subunit